MDGKQLTLIRLFQIHSYLGSVLRVSKRRPGLPFGFEGHTVHTRLRSMAVLVRRAK